MPEFYMIFVCKMPEFCMINSRKIVIPIFCGGGAGAEDVFPTPVSYACEKEGGKGKE